MAFATVHYFSHSLVKASAFNIIFPEGPAPRPWGVLYLLHGLSDDHTIWARRTSIERYVAGWPLVVVMPDGGRGWYTNAKEGPAYEDDLLKDVVGMVDRTFPVRAERAGRAIGGLSMGGYGAVKIALKHPDMFASAHSHSGALGFAHRDLEADKDKDNDNDKNKPRERDAEFVRIFGPRPKGGPEDPFALVERIDHGLVPELRIDCGTEDFLVQQNRDFHAHLGSLHIKHEYQENPGTHEWGYWDRHIPEAIAFHVRNLKLKRGGG